MSADPLPESLLGLGSRIRALREEQGLTQERLAYECGRSKGYLSDIEAGHRLPSLPFLAQIAGRLGVELFDLFIVPGSSPRAELIERSRKCAPAQIDALLVGLARNTAAPRSTSETEGT